MKISQLKSNIQIIITNLKQLQTYRDNLANNLSADVSSIVKCKQTLEEALTSLESQSLVKVNAQLKQRKQKRARRTARLKKKKRKQSSSNCQHIPPSNLSIPEQQPLTTLKKRELRCAKKYLDIMDCLGTLHQLRGGGDSCKLKQLLNPVRSIWQSTVQTLSAEEQSLLSIGAQWDQVLFGGNSEIEINCGMKDLIEKRCIWDSYLVPEEDSTGSHIPIGWVYPKEDARPEWKLFKS